MNEMRKHFEFIAECVGRIEADFARSADTHLLPMHVPFSDQLDFYWKDESTHITGSLKHRLARSLFLYALCNGRIHPDTPIIEASSGSTAVSEAYFAKLLGLRFIAVMPESTSPVKVASIRRYGGECHFVKEAHEACDASRKLARELNGHFMDQFTYAERATDWRGNNNIAESIFEQMQLERFPDPRWLVCGAGTGGTSATLGRFVRYRGLATQLCVVDPEGSAFFDGYVAQLSGDLQPISPDEKCGRCRVEGIGRPRVEPSFLPSVVDAMVQVPDVLSFTAVRWLETEFARRVGPSTGTNFIACLALLTELHESDVAGSVVSLLCDSGDRYTDTAFNNDYARAQGFDYSVWLPELDRAWATGMMSAKLKASLKWARSR